MAIVLFIAIAHLVLTHASYLYSEPYFYKQIYGFERAKTHYENKERLYSIFHKKEICIFLMYVPALHIYSFYKFNVWLAGQLQKNKACAVKMTLFGPFYYPYLAFKMNSGR